MLAGLVLVAHFVGDFIFQSDWMATNKSRSYRALLMHIGTYMLALVVFGPLFALVNGIAHFMIDWCTSRGTSWLWQHERRHEFFVLIGFDQLLHALVLLATLRLVWPEGGTTQELILAGEFVVLILGALWLKSLSWFG